MPISTVVILISGVILALSLDYALIWYARRRRRMSAEVPVYVLGSSSPVLTWLKRRLPPQLVASENLVASKSPNSQPAVVDGGELAQQVIVKVTEPRVETSETPVPEPQSATVVPPRIVESVAIPLGPRLARIEITLELAPGERVQLLVEAAPADHSAAMTAPVVIRNETVASPEFAVPSIQAPSGEARLLSAGGPPPAMPVPTGLPLAERLRLAWEARATGVAGGLAAWEARVSPRLLTWSTWLFGVSLVVYLLTRLWGIDRFPIFFYSDEANNVLLGEQVFNNGLRAADGTWLPLYFEADNNRWTPLLWTYFEAVVAAVFGKSVFVARSATALVSTGAVLAIALLLKRHFQARFWWASALLLALVPVWFLYSRTAWEYVLAVTAFAGFLYCYAQYRLVNPRYLYAALGLGALAFYAYSNAQLVMVLLSFALLISDWRYHLAQRSLLVRALPLAGLLALPFFVFWLQHPTAMALHLGAVGSYWTQALPLPQKLLMYASHYLRGLSPVFWFASENGEDIILPAQRFAGQGHLGWVLLPLLLAGGVVAVRQFRASPLHRLIVLALLAAPASAALDGIEARRVLLLVVPAVVLAGLGLEWILNTRRAPRFALAPVVVLGLGSLLSLGLLRTALVEGPFWYTDYGLYGAQYGVKQIFEDSLPELLRAAPARRFLITTGWANNVHLFPRFFLTPEQQGQVVMGNIDDYLNARQDISADMAFVLTANEFERIETSGKLVAVETLAEIDYPTGAPAFVIARLAYTAEAEAVFAAESMVLRQPLEAELMLDGRPVRVLYTAFEDGAIETLFDGNYENVVRGIRANPYVLELHFAEPRLLTGMAIKVGSTPDVTVSVVITSATDGVEQTFSENLVSAAPDPLVEVSFGSMPVPAAALRLEVKFNAENSEAPIHLWEVALR